MKIKVTFEKIFDSNEFYSHCDAEDLEDLTYDDFVFGIQETYIEFPEDAIEELKYELIEEND